MCEWLLVSQKGLKNMLLSVFFITGVCACVIMCVCLVCLNGGQLCENAALLFKLSMRCLCGLASLHSSWTILQSPRLCDNNYLNCNCHSQLCPSPLKPPYYIIWILSSCLSFASAISTASLLCVWASVCKTVLNEGYNYAGVYTRHIIIPRLLLEDGLLQSPSTLPGQEQGAT